MLNCRHDETFKYPMTEGGFTSKYAYSDFGNNTQKISKWFFFKNKARLKLDYRQFCLRMRKPQHNGKYCGQLHVQIISKLYIAQNREEKCMPARVNEFLSLFFFL